MRLPWVSRSLYEQAIANWQEAQRAIERWQNDYLVERAKVDAQVVIRDEVKRQCMFENQYLRDQLAAKDAAILALRREGFDPPDPRPPTTHEIRAKLDPAILHRIEQIAQPGTKEHFEMLQEAEALVGAYPDRAADAIADEVTEGCPISPYRL